MTTSVEALSAVYTRFRTLWGIRTDIATVNVKFDTENRDLEWVRLSVTPSQNYQQTLGGKGTRKFQRTGIITVQIFVPIQTNILVSTSLSDEVLSIFEGEKFNGVVCNNSNVTPIGRDGKWYQTNVNIDYNFIETK